MSVLTRRRFLYCSAAALSCTAPFCGLLPAVRAESDHGRVRDIRGKIFRGDAPDQLWRWSREGYAYRQLEGQKVMCGICPNRCLLAPGDRSVCRSKVNFDGKLYTLAYGNPCAVNLDPIEKKPLFHFHPRSTAFSIAAAGCNLRCLNCQNWEISQAKPHEVRSIEFFPAQVVEAAGKAGAKSIAYTYSEPITFYEYMLDTARAARKAGIFNLMISNGYIREKPLQTLCTVIDAANINLKSFNDDTYRTLNGGRLQPILETFKTLHRQGVHFEMTTLVVPDYVDDPEMIRRMCAWILENLGPDHPLHFTRFFPRYRLNRLPPTPVATLEQFRDLALQAGIRYVYVGNVANHPGMHTWCHGCGKLLIERKGYLIPVYNLDGDRCKFCNTVIPGVWA
jgi:pyruvate formate lyase activating enzyme